MVHTNPRLREMLLIAFLSFTALFNRADAADQTVNGRALLIGCTTYDHLDPSLHLQGPANDVAMMQELLCQRFGFPQHQVVMLTETSGRAELRPIRSNIEREFKRLGDEAQSGEQIVIFLAGHGTQQPDMTPSPDDSEPDGLDELFLPADVQAWDGSIGQVPNAIVDDELRIWLQVLERRSAIVTVIVDSCHSGTMTRGTGERSRQIAPGVLVPLEQFPPKVTGLRKNEVPANAETTRGGRQRDVLLDASSVIAIYAAQSSEATVERLLPNEGEDRKPHGLLTYTLTQILSRSTEPVTFRELVQQIQTQYAGWGRSAPTPMIEGKDRDREVFGLTVWPNRSRILLSRNGRGWTVNAGLLLGVTQGSILSVFPIETNPSPDPIGFVRVQMARTTDADVVCCDAQGKTIAQSPPDKGRCEVVYTDAGRMRLRIAIVATSSAVPEEVHRIRDLFPTTTPDDSEWKQIEVVDNPANADWLISISRNGAALLPVENGESDLQDSESVPLNRISPEPPESLTAEWLRKTLSRIAGATNLKKIAANANRPGKSGESVRVDLSLERKGVSLPLDELRQDVLRNGENLTVRVGNPCQFPLDVTLLFIDNQFGIHALFPQQGEINRLQPGNSVSLPTEVSAEQSGIEHLVVIAVKSQRDVIDFTCLTQPLTDRNKLRGSSENPALESPLGQLLNDAMSPGGLTRGMKQGSVNAHSLKLISWRVAP